MQEAGEQNPGTLAAVLGMAEADVQAVCDEAGAEVCNLNATGQIVIGGAVPAVEQAAALAEERGARRVVMLNVGGAFHTSLMAPASDAMAPIIADGGCLRSQDAGDRQRGGRAADHRRRCPRRSDGADSTAGALGRHRQAHARDGRLALRRDGTGQGPDRTGPHDAATAQTADITHTGQHQRSGERWRLAADGLRRRGFAPTRRTTPGSAPSARSSRPSSASDRPRPRCNVPMRMSRCRTTRHNAPRCSSAE